MVQQQSKHKKGRLSAEQMLQGLGKDPVRPIYLLFGEERYLVRKALSILKKRALPEKDLYELLYHPVYASETKAEDIVQLARSTPFFGNSQLILVWDAEKLKESIKKALLQYVEDPAPFTCMVFIAGDIFPKGELFAFLKKKHANACLGFSQLKRPQRLKWLQKIAEEKGLSPRSHGNLLKELLSAGQTNLETLEIQLEILALYIQDQEKQEITDPLPFGPPEISFKQGYLLTDALMQGNMQEVLTLLNRFVEFGVAPLLILSRISQEIRSIWTIKEGMELGTDVDSLMRASRIPVFKKGFYLSQSRRISWKSLHRMFLCLRETDRSLKSSRLDPQWHLEALCGQIDRLVKE